MASSAHRRCGGGRLRLAGLAAGFALACAGIAPVGAAPARLLPPLLHDDEPIVVTDHQVQAARGPLAYQARAGRLAIRDDGSGELRGYVYFTAYVAPSVDGKPRPLTFLWNGGPIASSLLVHTEMFGPRRITAAGMVDNAETLLADSDLVFFDPMGTGFSRFSNGSDKEFLSTLGDFAETAEFVRAYRARFGAQAQPLFLGGESYGTWRVAGSAEMLEKQGIRVAGAILISGGVPGSLMPPSFQDAMYVPARTATAFELQRLPADLQADKAKTLREVNAWIGRTYLPALADVDALTPARKREVIQALARFTGVAPDQIDGKTLVMTNREFLAGFHRGDEKRPLNAFDMRIVGSEAEIPGRTAHLLAYFRQELDYDTDLPYSDLEDGYHPVPGPPPEPVYLRWSYNHVELTAEVIERMKAGGGPPLSQPWLQNAMRLDPALRVFVAAGRYDSLNMCEGNLAMSAKLEADLSRRFSHVCYEGGHMMYRDDATRRQLAGDIARFIQGH